MAAAPAPPAAAQAPAPDPAPKLTEGFLGSCSKPLERITQRLIEVEGQQTIQLHALRQENERFTQSLPDSNFAQTFAKLPGYQQKLQALRKDMIGLSDRMDRLKKRAEKLQQRKLQEELALAAQQEKQAPLPSKAGAKPPA